MEVMELPKFGDGMELPQCGNGSRSQLTTQDLPLVSLTPRSDSSGGGSDETDFFFPVAGDPTHILFDDRESHPSLSRSSSSSSSSRISCSELAYVQESSGALAEPEIEEDLEDLPSIGSKLHAAGTCTPCFFKSSGCLKGADCKYCHMEHVKKIRARPGKSTRNKYKKMAAMVDKYFEADSEARQQVVDALASENRYIGKILGASESQTSRHPAPAAVAHGKNTISGLSSCEMKFQELHQLTGYGQYNSFEQFQYSESSFA
eukprot:CAMPEP_0197637334 /NCGR_PEP_ID=MMETSP1338-20131121/12595_1 /TAXON_ID=43686 ORGANISM="Pelagodinium beii, Strain RCC1491" /NCGR_SAMPLE_ID=MMETSP1338 /ASSEMBLY_ACC=CAM_ASM_000754 /LENGTH=260 /DNA_ID=CAMNT_0043209745 /DNA_START=77 /DNA_END=859 /DNA_ORIENTATION=-